MIKTHITTGSTIGIKDDSQTIVAINLLNSLDITYLLEEIAKENPTLNEEVKLLNKKLSNKHITICYKSNIGKEISFSNNIFDEHYKC